MAKKNLMICKNSSSSLRLNESVGDGRYILEGIFAGPLDGTKNRNGRIYTAEEYLKHISYLRDDIKSGELMGCLDHPDIFEVKLKEASHQVLDIWYDDKTKCVMGKIKLLDTPNGKIAKELVDAGVPLHISSRASGSVNPDGTVKIQQIFTYDLVCKSGFKDAILHRVTESADVNKYSKDVMDYLTESEKVERKNIAKQYGFINEDVSIQEMAVAPKLRKEAKAIQENEKNYNMTNNINENSIDVQRVIDDSNFVLSVEISSNPEKIANLINTTSMKNPNVTVLCADGTVWFCFDNESDFVVPEDVEMERVKGFDESAAGCGNTSDSSKQEKSGSNDDNGSAGQGIDKNGNRVQEGEEDDSDDDNDDDKDDKGVEILDVQVEGGDDEGSDDEEKKGDEEDSDDEDDKNENVNEDDDEDDSDDNDDKDDKGVEILDVQVEGDDDESDKKKDDEDDTDEGCCKKKHKKDISEKGKEPDPEKDMIIDCKDIQARKEKFEDKFADLVDTIKSKSEKKKTNESNIINKYPISAMMNVSNFHEFVKLDESQKSKVVDYLSDKGMISINLVNENWKNGIDYERDTEIWLKYAPQNYRELYESASEATKKSISNMAAYVIFENASDVRRFWEGTGLKTQSERSMLNENFVNNMPKISKPAEETNLPYGKDFINMITEMACSYNNPY